ncbi:MAG: OsmC family protein [Candidatus Methylomirabilia bacterium]
MLYARRKGWTVDRVEARLRHERVEAARVPGARRLSGEVDSIALELFLSGDLTAEQAQRLRQIADRCPVHRALAGEVVISHA